ncbi:MAG: MBOAT family protein, partial [Lachnospiraceae bacterium]|nr:MBOAT family protein [Lachnospiraceae bacterium]
MVFSSLIFICRFFPVFLTIYLLVSARYRNLVLFLGSLVFYAWGEPVYIGLMLFSTFLDYGNGRLLGYAKRTGRMHLAKGVLLESVVVNLSLLCLFKYAGVFLLPVGISFYTFQTMSYTIDVYRGETPVQTDFIAFGAYVSMFPQLIAGPIVKYKDVATELTHRTLSFSNGYYGIERFVIGLGKKVLLANQIGLLWEEMQKIPACEMTTLRAWL